MQEILLNIFLTYIFSENIYIVVFMDAEILQYSHMQPEDSFFSYIIFLIKKKLKSKISDLTFSIMVKVFGR